MIIKVKKFIEPGKNEKKSRPSPASAAAVGAGPPMTMVAAMGI